MDYTIDLGRFTFGPPAPRPDPDAPLYAAADGRVASLANGECLFQGREGALHVMTMQVLQAMDQCREFRPLEDHVSRVVSVLPGLAGQSDGVRHVLRSLVDRQLLVSDGDFLAALGTSSGSIPSAAPMRGIFVRACDRPAQLSRLLDSLVEHSRRFDSRLPVWVIDDSRLPASAQENDRLIRQAESNGLKVSGIGSAHRERIVARLAKAHPESSSQLRTLCLPGTESGFGGGRGYNLALLLSAGARLAMLDEDYLFPLRLAAGGEAGLEPDATTPFRVRFHADNEQALQGGDEIAMDALQAQIDLVGRNLAQALAIDPTMRLDRQRLRGQSLARLTHLRGDSRVLATYTGSRGASFTSDTAWLFDIDPTSREAFWRERSGYLRNLDADAIEHAPERTLVRPFGLFTPMVLDNAQLLPCTATMGRGEDGLFGVTANYLYPDSVTLHLPLTVGHRQEGVRKRLERARRPYTPGVNRFLHEWIRNQGLPSRSASADDRLLFLATQFDDLSRATDKVLADTLVEYLRYVRADLIDRLQQQLEAMPDAPVYWSADARQIVDVNARALMAGDPPRLDDWPSDIDTAGCVLRLRTVLSGMAAGYRAWPALWRGAAALGEQLLAP